MVATTDPLDISRLHALELATGLHVKPVLAQGKRYRRAHRSAFRQRTATATKASWSPVRSRARWTTRMSLTCATWPRKCRSFAWSTRCCVRALGKPRFRRSYRAFRKSTEGSLPHRRHSARSRIAAAPTEGRGHFALQDSRAAQHRRAPLAAGRPHQDPARGQGRRPAHRHGADALRRKRRDPASGARPDLHRARNSRVPAGSAWRNSTR